MLLGLQVLSVIAQQLLTLREARLEGQESVLFEGRHIPLKEHHVVVTMNPGYAGRTELPDNLKVHSVESCLLCVAFCITADFCSSHVPLGTPVVL